jgi:hypothetical protein
VPKVCKGTFLTRFEYYFFPYRHNFVEKSQKKMVIFLIKTKILRIEYVVGWVICLINLSSHLKI